MAFFTRRRHTMLSPPAIVAIVLIAFLYAGYHEWLKAKSSGGMDAPPEELKAILESMEDRLAQVEQERDSMVERVRNLETIVTSEAWIAQHDNSLSSGALKSTTEGELSLPADSDTDDASPAEHTAELARRLRSNKATDGDL